MIPEPAHDAFQLFRIHEMERQPQHQLLAEQEQQRVARPAQRGKTVVGNIHGGNALAGERQVILMKNVILFLMVHGHLFIGGQSGLCQKGDVKPCLLYTSRCV